MNGYGRVVKLLSVAVVLGSIAIVPGKSEIVNQAGEGGQQIDQPGQGPEDVGTLNPTVGPSAVTSNGPTVTNGLECNRLKNGGRTATGVAADRVRLASTVVQTGDGASFLKDSITAMLALTNSTNSLGGVCGRLLDLKIRDDAWDATNGSKYLEAFIKEGVFSLPVVPSSEGLTAAIEARIIRKAGIPVIGTDGMLKQQYEDPWVWPVATATVSTMRIMAKFGYDKGARCFGIVYDLRYRFGREGAEAYRNYVKTLPGAKMCSEVGIYPTRASYSAEIQQFNKGCNNQCDFVAWLLEPKTALTWVAGRPQMGKLYTSGAQTLFNQSFAANCGKACSGMLVWTGYNPPIGNLAGLPDVRQYVNDVRALDPKADVTNQFMEGAYLGMRVFIDALKAVGPNLTRERLRDVLNSKCFKYDLASRLCWSASQRHANKSAQAFSIVVAQGSFAGFKNEQTGFIKDPNL